MDPDTDDYLRFIDPATRRTLDDVGLPGRDLAETIDTDGTVVLWIVDRALVDDRRVDLGNERPPHELGGALPRAWRRPVAAWRCGARTATGAACRMQVRGVGLRCRHHPLLTVNREEDRP